MFGYFLIALLSFAIFSNLAVDAATSQRPKLVLYLTADQFSCTYFSKCADKFQTNGFRQLFDNGADFTACRYAGATNQTASNLAVIATGAYPWSTGIVGNEWYDRRKQKIVKANLADENATTGEDTAISIHSCLGSTIGDELKISSNGISRVVSISSSQSNALLLAGKSRDEVFWWDCHSGVFTGLTYAGSTMPGWVKNFNSRRYSEKFVGKNWQSIGSQVSANTKADESFYTQFAGTPWANQMLVDFAKEAIQQENLGQHDSADVLSVNFPSFEIIGKNYGAYSPQAYELVGRFDRSMADLFQFVDSKVGLANCVIVFTAAHGAMSSPEVMKAQGVDAGIIEASYFRDQLNTLLSAKLGKADWIEAFAPPNLYLNLVAIDHTIYKQPDVEKLAAKLSRAVTGVGEIYTAFQFFMNQVPVGPLVESVQKSYFWGRSGELYVTTKPGFAFAAEGNGTTCGSPYSYDAQVPLIICGSSLKAGTYSSASSPADVAPTIANILNINSPTLGEGRVLSEALNWTPKAKYAKPNK